MITLIFLRKITVCVIFNKLIYRGALGLLFVVDLHKSLYLHQYLILKSLMGLVVLACGRFIRK